MPSAVTPASARKNGNHKTFQVGVSWVCGKWGNPCSVSDSSVSTEGVAVAMNNDPTANDDAATVASGSVDNVIDVLVNDSDPDSDPLIISTVSVPFAGTAVIDPAGSGTNPNPFDVILYTPVELLSNGTFDSDTSGWTHDGLTTWDAGTARLTSDGVTRGYIYQAIPCVIGTTYEVTVDITNNSTGTHSFVIHTDSNVNVNYATTLGGLDFTVVSGTYTFEFTATATTMYFIGRTSTNASADSSFDNISVLAKSDSFDYTVDDGYGGADTATVNVSIQ